MQIGDLVKSLLAPELIGVVVERAITDINHDGGRWMVCWTGDDGVSRPMVCHEAHMEVICR